VGLSAVLGPKVAVDTAVFTDLNEEHTDFLPLVAPPIRIHRPRRAELITSAVTLLEVLFVPYRAGNLTLAEQYEALLTRSRGLSLVDADRAQLRAAAQLRAIYRIRTPDALQLAAALSRECTTFVTIGRCRLFRDSGSSS